MTFSGREAEIVRLQESRHKGGKRRAAKYAPEVSLASTPFAPVPETGRRNMRVTLHSLREQMEPPGSPADGLLIADAQTVALNPAAFSTDVAELAAELQAAAGAADPGERARHLIHAAR